MSFTLLEQLNRWSQFQLPLVLIISAPSRLGADSQQSDEHSVITYDASPQHQARLVREMVPLLQAHPVVQGVVWNQWYDKEAEESGCRIPDLLMYLAIPNRASSHGLQFATHNTHNIPNHRENICLALHGSMWEWSRHWPGNTHSYQVVSARVLRV